MPDWPDWIWWSLGGLLAAAGTALLCWALFADRARGRRRCPRCWYDMTGTPGLTCSECGHRVRRERKLLKTRRHYRRAAIALLVIALGTSGVLTPKVNRDGWKSLFPTTVLIALMPELQTSAPSLAAELDGRMQRCELAPWQCRWLIRRMCERNGSIATYSALTRQRWPEGTPQIRYALTASRVFVDWPWLDSRGLFARISLRGGEESLHTHGLARGASTCLCGDSTLLSWLEPTCPMSEAMASQGVMHVTIQTIVELPCLVERASMVVQSDEFTMSFTEDGALEDLVKPARCDVLENWLRESLTAHTNEHGAWLRVRRSAAEITQCQELTLAFDVELLCDGEPVAATNAWCTAARLSGFRQRNDTMVRIAAATDAPVGMFGGLWPEPIPRTAAFSPGSSWTLRLRPNPELALRDFQSSEYLNATIEIPLAYSSSPMLWQSNESARQVTVRE